MRTMKGPGIFLSQFIGEKAPFNTLDGLAGWAAAKGYKAVQIPCNHPHIFDVEKAASWARTGWSSASCRPIWRGSLWR